jgi:hypothetical protein
MKGTCPERRRGISRSMGSRRGGGAWTGGAVLSAFVFSYWVPVSWVAWDARELVYARGGCEAGGGGTDGIRGRDQGQCGGVPVRGGSVGPVAAEDIAAGGGGAVAGDPGGMRVTGPEEARAIAAQHLSPRYGIRTRSQNRCKSPAMLNGRC